MKKRKGVKAWGQTWGNDPSAPLLLCEQASVLQSLRHVTLWRKGEERRNISCSLANPTQANVEPELPHPLLSPGVPAQQELLQLPQSTAGVQLPWELRHGVSTGFGALLSKSRLRRRGHLSKAQVASLAHSPQLEPRAGKLLRERNLFNSHQSLPFTLLVIADSGQQLLPLEITFTMIWAGFYQPSSLQCRISPAARMFPSTCNAALPVSDGAWPLRRGCSRGHGNRIDFPAAADPRVRPPSTPGEKPQK